MRRKIKRKSPYPLKEFSQIPITMCVIYLDTDNSTHDNGQSGGFKLPTGFLQTDKAETGPGPACIT